MAFCATSAPVTVVEPPKMAGPERWKTLSIATAPATPKTTCDEPFTHSLLGKPGHAARRNHSITTIQPRRGRRRRCGHLRYAPNRRGVARALARAPPLHRAHRSAPD